MPRLPKLKGVYLEVSATEPQTDQIVYLPLRYEFDPDNLLKWIKPHTTSIINVELLRLPSDIIFKLLPA
jgi:hypothetical protein